jgi:DNA-binding response OmpR family regulator
MPSNPNAVSISGKTILVVDDEPKIVEVVCSYLSKSGFSTLQAANGEDAVAIFRSSKPDLIILDLMLGDMSGEEICQLIRQTSTVPIIMLTAKADEESLLKGLAIGADDYVQKPFSPRQLVARVNALLRRASQQPLTRVMTFEHGLKIDTASHLVKMNDKLINLTPSEYKLLELMAKFPGRCFSRAELVDLAFGDDFDGFDRAVDSHIKNLRQKIESDSRNPLYIQTVFGIGYRFGGDPV